MDKLGGICIVLLLHHADMGVNSKAFHTSPTGHTIEHQLGPRLRDPTRAPQTNDQYELLCSQCRYVRKGPVYASDIFDIFDFIYAWGGGPPSWRLQHGGCPDMVHSSQY